MADSIGERAVVIGAGMGGLTAAAALSEFFSQVIVLERDKLPAQTAQRPGIPQGRHVHALLGGGQDALEELLPGFDEDLAAAGAVRYQAGLDVRVERPGFDPFPQRDLGWHGYAMSRPLIECVVRQLAVQRANISLCPRCSAREIVATDNGTAVQSVRFENSDGKSEALAADLIVDASGRGALTHAFLEACGFALPQESTIGVDIHYATTVFSIPGDAPSDWKGIVTFPNPQVSSRGGIMLPLEGGHWILTLAGAHGETPPGDADGFMNYAQQLRTRTIYNAIRNAERVDEIARFAFPASARWHFELLASFPRGLLPMADVLCRFNPVYGQGMSVAAMEACVLKWLLARRASQSDPLAGLAAAFFAEVAPLLETPWGVAKFDFVYPQTRGERTADFETTLKFVRALNQLAAREPSIHRLMLEVQHLLKPSRVYQEPAFRQRIAAEMALS